MKKISILMSFILLVGSLAFSIPSNTALATSGSTIIPEDGMEIITDTEEKSEYILTILGVQTRYIETTETIDENTIIIHTKVYNEDNHELIQDFSTTLTNDKIVDQDVILFEEIPEPKTQEEASGFYPMASTSGNKSMVTILNISYTKNFTTGKGTARYLKEPNKTAKLASSKPFNTYANNVDSLRGTESSTTVGWLVSGFSGGSLVAGKIISWATAKTILTKIAGPVAVVSNAVALSSWFYYYNKLEKSWSNLK
ncbi:hypothetical protein ABG775_09215 [Peribacillus simplex]|uniref:hypothetical protein n=3 Tax=Peribacillus TaxID=2675229 RepID=UPI0033953FAA